MSDYTDAQLKGYLNGTMTGDEAAALEMAVAGDTDLEQRLMALDPFAGIVHTHSKRFPMMNVGPRPAWTLVRNTDWPVCGNTLWPVLSAWQ